MIAKNFYCLLFFLIIVDRVESSVRIHGRRGLVNDVRIQPTTGEPWPKPQSIQITDRRFAVHPDAFHFRIDNTSQSCDLLISAFVRYYRAIFYPQSYLSSILQFSNQRDQSEKKNTTWRKSLEELGDTPLLGDLYVHLQQPCDQWPSLESNESCMNLIQFFLLVIIILSVAV